MKLTTIATSILALTLQSAPANAATVREIFNYETDKVEEYVCAQMPWHIRHMDGTPSGKQLMPGECIVMTSQYIYTRKEAGNHYYLRVRGVSGNNWLLRMDKKTLIDLGW